jgi:hypothetical protein
MDTGTSAWIVAITGAAIFCGVLYWVRGVLLRGEMMRCPEKGSIAFIRIAAAGGGSKHGSAVTHCDLLAKGEKCDQRCLERHSEITHGTRINPNASRPFVPW